MGQDLCFRCGVHGRVFVVAGRNYCEKCAELCINDRPDYRKADRRSGGHEPRGFGRRFQDAIRNR